MTLYKCIQRLSTDGGKTVHEVGETVDLSDADAAVAIRMKAVDPTPVQQTAPVASTPILDEVKQAADQLEQQVQEMEHEGGAQS
ncbi:hypothetical protein [Alicyclobacillus fastidiosus]|uniref:Uncharacterized protein n=1 Tax=Alicyclobacillus fastidiosus TaxID=392011 RepID=A0ABV5AK92_9BACL|nr:hypothetical protein [Alicyclobacillus fastidiosus]WEH09271.1 hypothetical protein PYS47_21780 [Alicyclobacillus fastidiosus]